MTALVPGRIDEGQFAQNVGGVFAAERQLALFGVALYVAVGHDGNAVGRRGDALEHHLFTQKGV